MLPELTPGGDASLVGSYLQVLAQQGINAVLIVSHLPLVGYLVAELCPGECPPMFATSAIANVDLAADGSYGKFEWQVSPSQVMAKV